MRNLIVAFLIVVCSPILCISQDFKPYGYDAPRGWITRLGQHGSAEIYVTEGDIVKVDLFGSAEKSEFYYSIVETTGNAEILSVPTQVIVNPDRWRSITTTGLFRAKKDTSLKFSANFIKIDVSGTVKVAGLTLIATVSTIFEPKFYRQYYYQIINKVSGYGLLPAYSGERPNERGMHHWPMGQSSENQDGFLWRIVHVYDDYYQIINKVSGYGLLPQNSGERPEDRGMHHWPMCQRTENQCGFLWKIKLVIYEREAFDPQKQKLLIPNENVYNPKHQITLEAWFNTYALGTRQAIIYKPYTSRTGGEPYYNYNLELRDRGQLYFALAINGVRHIIDEAFLVDPRKWYHVAATYDGKIMRLYLNGKEWEKRYPVTGLLNNFPTDLDIGVGKKGSGNPDRPFKGQLAEVRIWKVARSADQIRAAMLWAIPANEKDLVWSSTNWLHR
jgi:hypothetical protein